MDTIFQAVASIGFPAVMCLLIFWKMDKQDENYRNIMYDMQKIINDNSLAITKLTEQINALSK